MFSVRKLDDTAIILLDSSIEKGSMEKVENLKAQCNALHNEGIRNIILNMEQVENAPSIVLGTIVVLQKRMKKADGNIVIASPTEQLKKIFQITRMDEIIGIYDTEESALCSLNAKGIINT